MLKAGTIGLTWKCFSEGICEIDAIGSFESLRICKLVSIEKKELGITPRIIKYGNLTKDDPFKQRISFYREENCLFIERR